MMSTHAKKLGAISIANRLWKELVTAEPWQLSSPSTSERTSSSIIAHMRRSHT